MLTSSQIRAARGCLNISQIEASQKMTVSLGTLQRAEANDKLLSKCSGENVKKMRDFYEESGIEFIPPRKGETSGHGVRFFPDDQVG